MGHRPGSKALGGVLGDGQQSDVVDDDQVRADDLREGSGGGVVPAVAADQDAQILDPETGDGQASFDRSLPESLGEVRPSRPYGPQIQEIFRRPTHSRLFRASWVALGTGDLFSCQPRSSCRWEPGPLAASVKVGSVASGEFLGQHDADDLRGITALGLRGGDDAGQRPPDVREFHALGQLDGLGERIAVRAVNGAKRGVRQRCSLSSYSERSGAFTAGAPRADQAEVPGCSE